MSFDEFTLLRLRVVADADAGALARILEKFQNLNMVPRNVLAELSIKEVFLRRNRCRGDHAGSRGHHLR
jgi:hypothetical protein